MSEFMFVLRLRIRLCTIGLAASVAALVPVTPLGAVMVTATLGSDATFPNDAEIIVQSPGFASPTTVATASMEQSFRVSSAFDLGFIHFASSSGTVGSKTVNLMIYRVTNTLATSTPLSPDTGDILLQESFVTPAMMMMNRVVRLALDVPLSLDANTGTDDGYVMRLSGTSGIGWIRTGAGSAVPDYAPGSAFSGNGVSANAIIAGRDFAVAFSAATVAVPEPGAFAFLALAAAVSATYHQCRRRAILR